jgi:mxaA protein
MIDQPRATGYFVGDLLTQRILVDGRVLNTLPPPGRVNSWFERRKASVQTDVSGHRWLVVEYQILNAPSKLTTVTLPGWALAPPASINISPLSPPGTPVQVGTADLRVDHLAPQIPTEPIERAIQVSAGALVVTLLVWLAWNTWRNIRAQATQPFARALREMRTLDDDRAPQAWQILHRAFDRTAGRVIQIATLPTLFEHAPQLAPARAQIEAFFAQSNSLFFGTSLTNPDLSPRALCVALRRIEKEHER